MHVSLTVNGEPVAAEVEPRLLLAELIRDRLGLTGTKVGCDTGQCGSCTLLLDGRSAKSCSVLAVQAEGAEVTTIEGVNPPTGLDGLQDALWDQHAAQCGFCIPGMVMSLRELLDRDPTPGEAEVRSWLSGNLCRCTGYHSIVRAALSLARTKVGQTNG
jgi:aerobic carbon-monoxide dehydrogenase small subunit